MSVANRIGKQARLIALETGIAFGWDVGSMLLGNPVCIAACIHCDGLETRAEMTGWPIDSKLAEQVKVRQEVDVWQAFKLAALTAGCPHVIEYTKASVGLVVPSEVNGQYHLELADTGDQDRCVETGIAFGPREDGGFIAGCCFCAYAMRIAAEAFKDMGDMLGAERATSQLLPEMIRAALKKTCPHWFDYQRRFVVPKGDA